MKGFCQLIVAILVMSVATGAPEAPVPESRNEPLPTGDVLAHDPVMIEAEGTYYLFTTGPGVTVWTSSDLQCWSLLGPVFEQTPAWVQETVPEFRGHFWAPDIVFREGRYFLYYSVSTFGRNNSAIGVATNVTLDPEDPHYQWVDRGKVIESFPGLTAWNAIDPQFVEDRGGIPYLAFGSFWEGLKIARLSPALDAVADDWETLPTLARRAREGRDIEQGGGPIEAPFIFRRGDYFYLFASVDFCCRGPESTYKMIVGRSQNLLGPYVDSAGTRLLDGGGDVLLTGGENWYGVGHNAVYTFGEQDYLVFHGYDASTDPAGRPRLRIESLLWDTDGWPLVDLDAPLRSATCNLNSPDPDE